MNDNKERIRSDFAAFCERIDAYQTNIAAGQRGHSNNCQAAYEGLYKFIQRIKKELRTQTIDKHASRILHQICEDTFLNGLLELRKVATHIQSDTGKKSGYIKISAPSGQPVSIPSEASAGAVFFTNVYLLPEPSNGSDTINHLQYLNTARDKLRKKLQQSKIISGGN